MFHRALLDPIPRADADVDTAAMAETTGTIERGERHLRMLAELGEIGMRLARSLGQLVDARVERELKGEVAPGRSEDAAAAFDKMAQTVRRTAALEAQLAEGVKVRREGLITQRAERRATLDAAHKSAKSEAILYGLHDAYAASTPDAEYQEQVERLMEDVQEYLGDPDEMRGYLDRPVGETVARLCAALGVDPDTCTLDDGAWTVLCPPSVLEQLAANRAGKSPASLSRSGEGQDAQHPGWGNLSASANAGDHPTQPHPDG